MCGGVVIWIGQVCGVCEMCVFYVEVFGFVIYQYYEVGFGVVYGFGQYQGCIVV